MEETDDRRHAGTVFNIQKYSIHDGPGIRTLVFLKGCALSCRWCSNPESQRPQPELAYNKGRCLGLDKCVRCPAVCVRNALSRSPDGTLDIDRARCQGCHMPCVDACPAEALIAYGKTMTVEDVLAKVEQDGAFYARSGGGMTLSGGEPLYQADFALALLREAKRRHLKTAMETSGLARREALAEAAPLLNDVLFDIKHVDSRVHEAQTGMPNDLILANFRMLAEEFADTRIRVRTPIIPGFNDDEATISAIAAFLEPYPRVEYELLPYHRLGTQKYVFLDRSSPMGETALDKTKLPRLESAARDVLKERFRT
ncbi:MAG: glycyl-radical enzyme activating protein [Desulfovibrio sp.]|jgi:pyruvate formate lyase activating enzyme|nr:glycyl-radical enzyme activating protein [Desulfovibrio sp.]